MKKQSLTLLAATLCAAALAFTGCNKRERADASAKTQDAIADTKAAVADAWGDVKSYTYEKRDDFSKNAKAMSAKMDAQISAVRTNYSEAKASASRKAAMEELKNDEANYKEKLDALGHATAATWDSARQNVVLAWDKLQASYYKARAD